MTKRLQVLLDEEEYRELQGVARKQRVTLAEWVRQALRQARSDSSGDVAGKLRVIADAYRHEFPTADIDVMLQEIDAGQSTGRPLVEEGLRLALSSETPGGRYTLPDCSVGEAGGTDPLEAYSWQDFREVIYGAPERR